MSIGEVIKPDLSPDEASSLVAQLYGLEVTKTPTELNSYDDRNFHVQTRSGHKDGYILKVINSQDSKNIGLFEAQTAVLNILKEKGLSAPIAVPNVHGENMSVEELSKKRHIVRLLEFLPGKILKSVPASEQLYFQVGAWAAKLNNALQTFQHPGLIGHLSLWHLKSLPQVNNYIQYVPDPQRRALVSSVLQNYINTLEPLVDQLPSGIIHGDLNEQNILVTPVADGWEVSSILDFGDINIGSYVFEVGAAIAYMMMDAVRCNLDPLKCGGATLAGYRSVRQMTPLELKFLKLCVCGRITQSLVLGLYTISLQPDNEYIGDTQTTGWKILQDLWNISDKEINSAWQIE